MMMPSLDIVPLGSDQVRFRTLGGEVGGTAYCKRGHNETQYDALDARRVNVDVDPKMEWLEGSVGEFHVVGVVNEFVDVNIIIEVHGFEFWIVTDEVQGASPANPLCVGDHVACRIVGLTLYLS
jgi:hypothetical protein